MEERIVVIVVINDRSILGKLDIPFERFLWIILSSIRENGRKDRNDRNNQRSIDSRQVGYSLLNGR